MEATDKGQVGDQATVGQLFPVLPFKGEANHPISGWHPKDQQSLLRIDQG